MKNSVNGCFFVLSFVVFLLVFESLAYSFSMGYHYDLIREAMRKEEYYGDTVSDGDEDPIQVALAANSYTDIFQQEKTKHVVDNGFFWKSHKLVEVFHCDRLIHREMINKYWRQLIHNTHSGLEQKIAEGDHKGALIVIGVTLHVVQDFYAHSNWVDLDLPRISGIKDATYFDVLVNNPPAIDAAIEDNYEQPFMRYFNEKNSLDELSQYSFDERQELLNKGLYTHSGSIGTPHHDDMSKDHAGRPHFDWAYRCAYKASLQWLRMIEDWFPDFVEELKDYDWSSGDLNVLTNFDEGTIRWFTTYGGAWKKPGRWPSDHDIINDNMPNVYGFGVWEQMSADHPFMGNEWFKNAALIASNLFEAAQTYSVKMTPDLTSVSGPTSFDHTYVGASGVPTIDTPIVNNAINYLGTCISDDEYDDVQWVRIQIPQADDLDTGEGFWNVNNEEVGGRSDYWVKFIVADDYDHPYVEAEYIDNSHPFTLWGVLKPWWLDSSFNITIKMYESDLLDHKDEHMDINPNAGKNLSFMFNPPTATAHTYPEDAEAYSIPGGYLIKSRGHGDLRAQVFVKVWNMADMSSKVEFVTKTSQPYAGAPNQVTLNNMFDDFGTDNTVRVDIGSFAWDLNKPDIDDFKQGETAVFAFEPKGFNADKMTRLRVYNDSGDPWLVDWFYLKDRSTSYGDDAFKADPATNNIAPGVWVGDDSPLFDFNQSLQDESLLVSHVGEEINYFSVYTTTGSGNNADTNDKVTIAILNNVGSQTYAQYVLESYPRDVFEKGHVDFFWLKEQYNVRDEDSVTPAGATISNIGKIRVTRDPEGDDDWHLKDLEVWGNGHLLYRGSPNVWLNQENPSWETNVVTPKRIAMYYSSPQSQDIQDVPDQPPGTIAHEYIVPAHVECIGFNSPSIQWNIEPDNEFVNIVAAPVTVEGQEVAVHCYQHKDLNPNYTYTLTVTVSELGEDYTETKSRTFSIPRPQVLAAESSFNGGNQVYKTGAGKAFRYQEIFGYMTKNFAPESAQDLTITWTAPDNAYVLSQDQSEIGLRFYLPNAEGEFQYMYPLGILAVANNGVEEASTSFGIKLPKLSVDCNYLYYDKVKSIFQAMMVDSDNGYAVSTFSALDVNDQNYSNAWSMVESGDIKEVGVQYNTMELTATSSMKRGGTYYGQVIAPHYSWDVSPVPPLTYAHPVQELAGTPVESETVRSGRGQSPRNPWDRPRFNLSPKAESSYSFGTSTAAPSTIVPESFEIEHMLEVTELASVEDTDEITVECTVTNVIGEESTFVGTYTNTTGLAESKTGKLNMIMTYQWMLHTIPEIFKGTYLPERGAMRNFYAPIDPMMFRAVKSANKRRAIKDWDAMRKIYKRYGDKRLFKNVRMKRKFLLLNNSLIKTRRLFMTQQKRPPEEERERLP